MEKIGIIAGNRLLPLLLARRIKQKNKDCQITAICFKGETSRHISKHVDKPYWLRVGKFSCLRNIIKKEGINRWIMAGQINPMHIFKKRYWDRELTLLVEKAGDFRPHAIFGTMIDALEKEGAEFLDSTLYLKEDLADTGVMNGLNPTGDTRGDIDFGLEVISKFVELDVGQVIGVKKSAVTGLESLEGTDRTIKRIYRLAGRGCTILKFCKAGQDLRFDVPVVGISTLKLLRKIKAASLVLEANKVIILQKDKFLFLAKKWNIPVVGKIVNSQ